MLNMSVEELLALKDELQVAVDEEKSVSLSALLEVEEELLRRLSRLKKGESPYSAKQLQQEFIAHLLKLGAYTKTYYKRDGVDDQKALGKVLKYDRANAIAYYRLGLYAYKKKFYITAAVHFNNAIKSHKQQPQSPYSLSDQQYYQVLLYLQNSTLKVAGEAEGMARELEENKEERIQTSLEFPSIQENVDQYEKYLNDHEFVVQTEQGMKYTSEEEAEQIKRAANQALILLFLEDRQVLIVDQQEVPLTIQQATILKHYLLSEEQANTKNHEHLPDCLIARDQNGDIAGDVYQRAIARLQLLLNEHKLSDLFQERKKSFFLIQKIEQY